MAQNSERYNKIREKINKKTNFRRKKVEEVKKEENTFMSEIFPVVIISCIIVCFIIFYFLFNKYKEVLTIDNDGFLLNTSTLVLGSKKTEADSDSIDIVNVSENDLIYKNVMNYFVDSKKEERVNVEYPLFINDGLSIINYNENVNLIDNNFIRSTGYEGLIFSYGKAYDSFDFSQIDKENYLLLSYSDNVMINLYDIRIKTAVNEYFIPVNSFVYFEEESLSYYLRDGSKFEYGVIEDIDFKSTIEFYYEANEESYEYDYETFLRGIDTLYIKEYLPEEPITPEKPEEKPVNPPAGDSSGNVKPPEEFKWEKPSVSVSDIKPNVYSLTANLKVHDPGGVIVKAPTFTFYRNNKTFLRRTYYSSTKMSISGLVGETTFTMVGTYTYLAEDMKTRIVVTFYSNKVTTGSLDSLEPITLGFENGPIYSKMIEINNLKVTSDLRAEAIKGVSKVGLRIDDKMFYLNNVQVSNVINGIDTTINTPESLNSSSVIDYSFVFLDREDNEIKVSNPSGKTRTSKVFPNISIRVKDTQIDSVTLAINQRNPDKIVLNNYIYVVSKLNGEVIKRENVTSETIVLTDLDPDQIFKVSLYADIDVDDGVGVRQGYELANVEFTSKPITTLGYINLSMNIDELTHKNANLKIKINEKKTNTILTRLLQYFIVELYDETGEELVRSYEISDDRVEKLKKGELIDFNFDDLESNKKYKIKFISVVKQGSSVFELDTTQVIDSFETNKKPAQVLITNSFTTETMIDFDIRVVDVDQSIQSDYVRLEFRDKDKNIVDTRKILVNQEEAERITYDKLRTNEFYNVYVYADGYNETNVNANYKYRHLLAEYSIYTESGISGNIELVSSLRVSKGYNFGDLDSEVKWSQMMTSYTIPKTMDEDGHMHIYAKSGSSVYTYDLSEYHGEIVTVSFKMKRVSDYSSGTVYFTTHLGGSSSSSYSKSLSGLNQNEWQSYTFTFLVGNYNSLSSMEGVLPASYDKTYDKYNLDCAGFYIYNSSSTLSEYEISDFSVHIQYDKKDYDYGDVDIEQGAWNTNTSLDTAKTENTKRVRLSKQILLEGGKRYKFDFDTPNDTLTKYYIHIYAFDAVTGRYKTSYTSYYSGVSVYFATNTVVRIMFSYNYDPYLIFPEDIANFRITEYKNNDVTGYTEFEYDLITKTKVTLSDKRDEISDNDYYIKVYENGEEKYSFNYVELENTDLIEDVVKELKLEENKDYVIELGILVRGRYYSLDDFELSTKHEVLGISTLSDWVFIQPYGHYILLNDLDFQDFTDQRIGNGYRYFHGEIDFQGYTIHQYAQKTDGTVKSSIYRFYRIESDAVLKNLVLDVHLNNSKVANSYPFALVYYNYGTIENVMVNIHDTMNHSIQQYIYGTLVYYNGLTGKINNFALNLNGDVHMYTYSGLMVNSNYGKISNGYIYGGTVIPDLPYSSNRYNGVLTYYNGPKSLIENVFSNISFKFMSNNYYDTLGIMAYETYGTLRNSYVVGDMNPKYPAYGPFVKSDASTSTYENLYYISDNIYSSSFQTKAATISLHDAAFQRDVLGDAFNIDEMIELGYFPQLKFSSNKMPAQEYMSLPTVDTDDYADIIYMEVLENKGNEALISVTVNNPLGEEITEIVISNLHNEIISQSYEKGRTILKMRVFNPSIYVSKYEVLSITSTSANGYLSTRRYSTNEKFLIVDMYKEIRTVNDFVNINKGLNQNYKLMNDLDFSGYSNYYINSFTGKFEGNNYTIRNVNLTQSGKSGLFSAVNGVLQNVTFENVVKSGNSSYHALIGTSNRYGRINNVHIKNMTIIGDNVPSSSYIGGLVGSASQSRISYSSISDVTIRVSSVSSSMNIGGLVGYGYGMFLYNSFAQNVDIVVENAVSTNGVGGLVGMENWSGMGFIENCYSTGSITTNTQYVGGLIGYSRGYVYDSFSSVDIVSEMSYVGGIAGYSYDSSYIQRNVYLGNLYSASTESNMRRIMGNVNSDETNYVMESNLINGLKTTNYYGASVLTYDDYLLEESYTSIFDGPYYEYSGLKDGLLPKLLDKDGVSPMPNQNDVRLFENEFNVNKIVMDKHADDVTVTLYLENPLGYEIKGLTVDDATVKLTRNATENGVTVLEFLMTPTMFFDCYRMSKLVYVNELDEEVTLVRFLRLDVIFYRNLSTYDDWQNISTNRYENYILTNDIDFSGKTNIKTGVKFNRLETPGENLHFALKNMNVEYTSSNGSHSFINRINRTLYNVKFENITIKDEFSGSSNGPSIIQYNYADTKNLVISKLNIYAPYKQYVGFIGTNYSSSVDNITIEEVNLTGRTYTAALIAYQSNSSGKVKNVTANNVNINVEYSGSYIGGIFGYSSSSSSYITNFTINDVEITGQGSYIGAATGTGYVSYVDIVNADISGIEYVGGAVGNGTCIYCNLDDIDVRGSRYVGGIIGRSSSGMQNSVVKNSKVYGSDSYIGGAVGYSYYGAYDSTVYDTEVYGTATSTYGVGGFAGMLSTDTIYRCGVVDTIVSNAGTKTAGFIGYTSSSANLYYSFIDNVTITGVSKTGGLIGELTSSGSIYANRITDSTIVSSEDYAGGIVGYYTGTNSIYEINVENSRIQATNYAGGFFGGLSTEPSPNYIRKLYYGGVTTTTSGHNYGFASGDDKNYAILKFPRIYLYENSLVNNKTANSQANVTTAVDGDLFENLKYTYGYLSGGNVYDYDYESSSMYSEMVHLEAGKTYEIHLDYKLVPDAYQIYIYNSAKNYVGTMSSSAESYIGMSSNTSYDKVVRFTAYKEIYIRVYLSYRDRVNTLKLFEVTLPNGVRKDMLLTAEQLREEPTWAYVIGTSGTTGNDSSLLGYSSSYWDLSPINKNNSSSVSITDLTSNKYVATGYVSSLNHSGMVLSGYQSGKDSYLTISNYKLPSDTAFTLSTKFAVYANKSYAHVFSSKSTSNSYGFALYLYGTQVYVQINSSTYNTGYYLPYGTPVDISVTYGDKILIVYVDGVEIYKRTNITLNSYSTYDTYIGYDRSYTSSSYRFVGKMYNLKVFNRTLDALEIENNVLASSGIIDSTGLNLHYDFTQSYTEYDAYYPLVKPTTMLKQEMYPLPKTDEALVSNPLALNYGFSNSYDYNIYASGIDTINIEFDKISDDVSFTYIINDKEYSTQVEKRVYTLNYDYVSDIEIIIKNAYGKKSIKLTSEDLTKKILHINNNYYNIDDNILYKNGSQIVNEVVHLYSNLALLSNGKVYNLINGDIYPIKSTNGILVDSIPLKTYVLNNRIIKTYYNHTTIDSEVIDGQMFIKDGHIYMFNNNNSLNDNVVYNIYNTEEYQIGLNIDGALVSYKAGINYPNTFANSNIKEITFDIDSEEPVIMIRYNSSNVLAFNYVTGEELFNYGEEMSFSLFDYLNSSLSYGSYQLTNSSTEYVKSKEFIKSLNNGEKNNVNDIINQYSSTSNNTSNMLKNEYISVYNNSTNKFDVYNINDIITDKKDIIVSEVVDGEIVVKDNINDNVNSKFDSSPLSDKVKSNVVLYDYFYNNKSNKSIKNNKEIIYAVIMILIVGNLFILSYVYSKKEGNYE